MTHRFTADEITGKVEATLRELAGLQFMIASLRQNGAGAGRPCSCGKHGGGLCGWHASVSENVNEAAHLMGVALDMLHYPNGRPEEEGE